MTTDGTKERKDTSSGKPGQSSSGTKGTSKDKGKLYTDADIAKVVSDAKSEAGRLQKAAEQERDALKQDLQSNKTRLDALEKVGRESRLAEARDNPELLPIYQREEAVTQRERQVDDRDRDITRREGQLTTDREEVDRDKGVVSVAYIAAKHGLKTEDLEELGISDPEALEKVAAKLATSTGKGADPDRQAYQALKTDAERATFIEAHPDFDKEAAELHPDSGDGGGEGELTEEQRLDQRFPTMKK